jgi:hypothetical protein
MAAQVGKPIVAKHTDNPIQCSPYFCGERDDHNFFLLVLFLMQDA